MQDGTSTLKNGHVPPEEELPVADPCLKVRVLGVFSRFFEVSSPVKKRCLPTLTDLLPRPRKERLVDRFVPASYFPPLSGQSKSVRC